MILRPYQVEAIDAIYHYFATHPNPDHNPVVALPTGTGKGVIIAGFTKGILSTWATQRVMMLTHVRELIAENARKMLEHWPDAPLGIYSAGLKSKVPHRPITFAGIQSAVKHPEIFGHVDLVMIDECHLVSPDTNSNYKKFIAELRIRNPALRLIGLSATPYRLSLGMITDGGIFTDVCYDATSRGAFIRLLDEGYLCPLIPIQTQTIIDVSHVHKRGGEFLFEELQLVVAREDITNEALNEAVIAAKDRKHWLVFATGIDHVEMVVRMLKAKGVTAAAVHSKLPAKERDTNIANFINGTTRALVNANILTTGFDFVPLDCIIMLRPTASPGLHVQMLGRGTRPILDPKSGFDLHTPEGRLAAIAASPKQNCLVLDFAGNTRRLGPINDPRIPKLAKGGEGDMPLKVCDHCGCLNHISAKVCMNCGEAFEFVEKIETTASSLEPIIRDEPITELFKVDHVQYAPHPKRGSPTSLKVSYYCGLRRFNEWVCLEHIGPIRYKAQRWWATRTSVPVPQTVDEAVPFLASLRVPSQIRVWVNKKYPDILAHLFEDHP
jgi:DNA repair protein RadD